jgi:hypothetical protein
VASGLSPEDAGRWAAVEFDPTTYRVWQEGARFDPWWGKLDRSVIVFDAPYVDLRRAPNTRGIVAWGAHDPGTVMAARPHSLLREFLRRYGRYPEHWTYGTPWPSSRRTHEMGTVLARALDTRSRASRWLAAQRFPDWDLFFAVAGEVHGTVEGLWHGVDATHPLSKHESARAAGASMLAVHRALDRMVAELLRCAGDAALVVFTMGGMGPNHSDTQSMVLLPELLFRHTFGRPLLAVPPAWAAAPSELPILHEADDWATASVGWVPGTPLASGPAREALRTFVRARPRLKAAFDVVRTTMTRRRSGRSAAIHDLRWQPATRYDSYWPRMAAFALPSFYDGRIRINLKGRERDGVVDPSSYEVVCRAVESLLWECRNPLTGEPAVDFIERAATSDPLRLAASESDLLVIWRGIATALEHPRLGLIGPVPLRRTGGHTGRYGMAYVGGAPLAAGDHGVRSSFDVAPTLVDLLGCAPRADITGRSLLRP